MFRKFARNFARMFLLAAILPLAGCDAPRMTDLTVTLLFRLNDTTPIADGKLTLIFDGKRSTVTTDAKGRATFHTSATLDRRWHWVNIGFTPFSWPLRADHLTFAAELDQSIRIGAQIVHYPVLYRLDLFRDSNGDCWNPGARVFGRDAKGQFTVDLDRPDAVIPLDGKMVPVANNGYRASGLLGDPATEKPLTLDLEFVRETWALAETAPH